MLRSIAKKDNNKVKTSSFMSRFKKMSLECQRASNQSSLQTLKEYEQTNRIGPQFFFNVRKKKNCLLVKIKSGMIKP